MREPLAEALGSRWRGLRDPRARDAVREAWRDRIFNGGLDSLDAAITIREDAERHPRGLRGYARHLMARAALQRYTTPMEDTE